MNTTTLPSRDEMMQAFLGADPSYDGVFVTGVHTTGIFCRPSCRARKPSVENVTFWPTPRDALLAGYRPCKRCRPLEPAGAPPDWLRGLLDAVENEPQSRWSEEDLRERGLNPDRVRRWFQAQHGMTFHAYLRARRLGSALGQIRDGSSVLEAALDHGYDSLSGFNDAFRRLFGAPPTRTDAGKVVTVARILTPLGPMLAGGMDRGLCLLEFVDRRMLKTQIERLRRGLGAAFVPGTLPVLETTAEEIAGYFRGERRAFTVPLVTPGSEFQRGVWERLRGIPYGRTTSYGELARELGRPSAVRAVARANGDNRIAVIIPCHRVVGKDGALTGYGGGLWRKEKLLALERGETI
jgi:AraC family transcriptional regulator, regulatory protein of adaptative response / methylated-DNA-[protein]-cysteine methyltransferase